VEFPGKGSQIYKTSPEQNSWTRSSILHSHSGYKSGFLVHNISFLNDEQTMHCAFYCGHHT